MKLICNIGILIILVCCMLTSIQSVLISKIDTSFPLQQKRMVFSILVEDPKEAVWLQRRLNLEIVKLEGIRLYYYDQYGSISGELKKMGYKQIKFEDEQPVNTAFYQLPVPRGKYVSHKEPAAALSMNNHK